MRESENRWLPLFPLQLVPLPGESIPLHIFEPRYQAMIGRCETGSEPFGIVLAVSGRLAAVGCEIWVERILRRYPDGRLDLMGQSRDRFRLLEVRQHDDGYIEGWVEPYHDLEEPEDEDARETLRSIYQEFRRILREGEQDEGDQAGADPALAAGLSGAEDDQESGEAEADTFLLAAEARLDLQERQEFLELTSERRREQVLMRHLARLMPILRGANVNRRLVRGNGRPKSVGGGGASG